MLRHRILVEWGATALVAVLLVLGSIAGGLTERFDNLLYDTASRFYAADPADDILIADIDDDSLKTLGKWPWSRAVHARMINALSAAGAKAVAYDVLFLEPGTADGDQALAESIRSGAPVILPVLYQIPGLNGSEADLLRPLQQIAGSAAQGSVNLIFDADGVVRRFELESSLAGQKVPHLMELAYRALRGGASPAYRANNITPLIPFANAGAFRHVPFSGVVSGEVPPGFFAGKMVLVGATAAGMGDRHSVSGGRGAMPGVEMQANLLNALLSGRTIQPAKSLTWSLLSLVPVVLLMLGFLRLSPGANLAASVLMIVTMIVASLSALIWTGFWVPPGPALLGLIVIYPLWGWRRLQALSSFVASQAALLTSDLNGKKEKVKGGGLDRIAEEATALGKVIGDMRSMRQFMSDVIAGFPDPVCVTDAEGRIALANSAAETVFGRDAVRQDFDQTLALLTSTIPGREGEFEARSGKHYLIRRAPFGDKPGAPGGEIIRLADISDLKAAGREREEMLQFLSHDMRAPQAAIIALAEHPGHDVGAWQRVTSFARHTLDLADEFVQLARLRAIGVSDETVDLANVMTEAIDMCWGPAKARSTAIRSSGIDEPFFVRGDASALMRVFCNLIGNATKYCPEGSEILCSLQASGDHVHCLVTDNGPGLPPERLEHAFTRFGMRNDASGSGLGLAFVKGVIDQHHGTITVESSASGTCFKITLPFDATEAL